MMKHLLISIGLAVMGLTGNEVCAQPSCRATLPVVPSDGYYAIDLPFQIMGNAQEDFADLRITGADGREVAWLLREDVERMYAGGFLPFPAEVTATAKETNVLITTEGQKLSAFTLRMKNADADKVATLRGSNDRRAWYAVKDRLPLYNTSSPDQTEVYLDLRFPLSDYRYYQLSIADSLSAPLNITGVGVMKEGYSYVSHLLGLPVKETILRTEGKQTDITLVLPYRLPVADIVFHISSPAFFERELKMWLPIYHLSYSRRSPLKGRQQSVHQEYVYRTLSADNGQPLTIAYNHPTDTLRMEIFNKDDQPLHIDSIRLYARKVYVVAALKQGVTYQLTCGDEQAVHPEYDLSFARQLPDSLIHLTPVDVKEQPVVHEAEPAWWGVMKTYGIWVVIALVMVQILFVIRKLLKQKS